MAAARKTPAKESGAVVPPAPEPTYGDVTYSSSDNDQLARELQYRGLLDPVHVRPSRDDMVELLEADDAEQGVRPSITLVATEEATQEPETTTDYTRRAGGYVLTERGWVLEGPAKS